MSGIAPADVRDDRPVRRVVVVGNGMAGGRFVEEVLARTGDGRATAALDLTVVGAEPYASYNRVLLSDLVAGRADVAALGMADTELLRAQGVDVRLCSDATALDLIGGRVWLDDGESVRFDHVVLATGAEPIVPPQLTDHTGSPRAGVHALRTVDDAREIVAATTNARRATVLGGGLLGLEAARGLARRGLEVSVVQTGPRLLPQLLDAAGASVLRGALRRLGVRVRTGATVVDLTHDDAGRLCAVTLAGPGDRLPTDQLPTDLLLVACGVRPRTALAAQAGLPVAGGILTDDRMLTGDPRVSAIGDCAEYEGRTSGLVAPAWDQARVVADLVCGSAPEARYLPRETAVRLKAADIDLAAVGELLTDPAHPDDGSEDGPDSLDVVQLIDAARGHYVKAVLREGIVVGAQVIGDARAAAELTLLVERGSPAPFDRAVLVLPGATSGQPSAVEEPTRLPDDAPICRCNGVSKGLIVRAWEAGARTRDQVAARTRATTGCGTCGDAVAGILDWLSRSDPDQPYENLPAPGARQHAVVPTPGGMR